MSGHISEFLGLGGSSEEFIEIALPAGTDPFGYYVHIYTSGGFILSAFTIDTPTQTVGGFDVYVIDASTLGFDDGGVYPDGNIYPDDALALVDPDANLLQFISFNGNTVSAIEGPAMGMTSTDVGTVSAGQSLQSDDGGSTYYAQSSPNAGSMPACYGPGSLIPTPDGPKAIEEIAAGDLIIAADGMRCPVLWVWTQTVKLAEVAPSQRPILIKAGALGPNRPAQDLVVSCQHRIVVGDYGQLDELASTPRMVAAKSLVTWPGVRFMHGLRSITWRHLLCADHKVILVNNLASETLLLGPGLVRSLGQRQLRRLSRVLPAPPGERFASGPVLPSLSVQEVRARLRSLRRRRRVA